MTDETARSLGAQIATQLGYDVAQLEADGVDLVAFGVGCNAAFNAWGGRTKLPVSLLTLPSTPTAGTGGPSGPPTPRLELPEYLARVQSRAWFAERHPARPVALAVGAAGILALSLLTLGWLPALAIVSMGFAPACAVAAARA